MKKILNEIGAWLIVAIIVSSLFLMCTSCEPESSCDCVYELYRVESNGQTATRTILERTCVEPQPEQWNVHLKDSIYYNIHCK